jgi:hypothetical protein
LVGRWTNLQQNWSGADLILTSELRGDPSLLSPMRE